MTDTATITLNVDFNRGYAPDQVRAMTLADLIAQLSELAELHGSDAQVVLHDPGQRGANYGELRLRDLATVSYGEVCEYCGRPEDAGNHSGCE